MLPLTSSNLLYFKQPSENMKETISSIQKNHSRQCQDQHNPRPDLDNSNSSAMSPDGSSVRVFSTDGIGKLGYSLGFSISILVLVTTILLASYLCNRSNMTTRSPPGRSGRPAGEIRMTDMEVGLDENILTSYPKLLYSQARLHEKGSTGSCCTICLADYKDTDMLRGLPDCSHMFHANCIDPWLRLHPTCPVCRASPLRTPLPTPIAEVAPLAGRS